MSVELVVDQVSQQAIVIATVTYSMSVVLVADQELFTIVDVQTFLKEIVTVMAARSSSEMATKSPSRSTAPSSRVEPMRCGRNGERT